MVDKNEEAKSMQDARANLERPLDRPMGGPLARDTGERTIHGLSPLDPAYNGTAVQRNDGIDHAAAARVEAGLEEPGGEPATRDVPAKDSAAS